MLTTVRNQTMKNPILKFGDVLLLCIALALASFSITGCAIFSKSASQEQKLADVRNLSRAAASIGTQEAILQNPLWLPRFVAARNELKNLVESKAITGALLRSVIASLPVKELKSPQAKIAIDSASMLWDVAVGGRLNIEQAPYLYAAASGILDGFNDALIQ
jgi:hypothetical protein